MKIKNVRAQHGRYWYLTTLEERSPSTGRRKRKWIPLTRVDEGLAALEEALKALRNEGAARQGNMPKLLQAFRKDHFPGLKSHEVEKEYGRMYDVIAKAFEEFNVDQVTPGTILTFLQQFADAPTARRHYKARLSTFFTWCVLQEYLTVNPCREIKLKAPPKRRGRLNDALFWAFYDALTPMGQCFLELMYLTRQRPTEIRLLRESAIGEQYIDFRPTKTETTSGEEVEILLSPGIRRVLDRARSLRPRERDGVPQLNRRRDPYIIQSEDGHHYTKSGLNSLWRRARDKLVAQGVPGARRVTTRDVRPYALHKMREAGYDLEQIQLAAAHASITTTEGYIEQHRPRVSDAVIELPARPKSGSV